MKSPICRFPVTLLFVVSALPFVAAAAPFPRGQLAVPAAAKFTVTKDRYEGLTSPNPRGWYYKCANVVLAPDGSLVACFQMSDNHTSLSTYVVVAHSHDEGKTWGDYQVISQANVWTDQAVWVVPQMSVLKDRRILIICDRGQRTPGQSWPMLSDWQKPDRGMANFAFWSTDSGHTWTKPEKIDAIGGEPGYPIEMSDGTLAFTRTESAKTEILRRPPQPWGNIYYRNAIVFSDDHGKSWNRSAWISDDPYQGDCEVGLVELAPGKLLAATRIGLGNGRFGNPSRLIASNDSGRTWDRGVLAPFNGQRVHLGKLQSGKLLATYRNVWGTPGSRAVIFDPAEKTEIQPNSWILDESRCALDDNILTLRTAEGKAAAVDFSFYPAQDDRAKVEIEVSLRVESAEANGCAISAGCWIQFLPNRISFGDRPAVGFACDTTVWHRYLIVRDRGILTISIDGTEKLREPVGEAWCREVHFGNRPVNVSNNEYRQNASVSQWRSLSIKVNNPDDYSAQWTWDPARGYPDQYRRDRVVVLDQAFSADGGYSSWTQLPNGKIVIVDYTNGGNLDSFSSSQPGAGSSTFVRAYVVTEKDLVRP